eukprot:jgi/Picsp_1/6441/NSC_03788-R1_protein
MDLGDGNPIGVDQELWPEEKLDFGAKGGDGGNGEGNNQLFDPDSLMFESIVAKQCNWGSNQALHCMDEDLDFEASLFPGPEGNSGFFSKKNVCSPAMDVYGVGEEMDHGLNPYDSSEGSLYQDIRPGGAEKPPKVKYERRQYQGSNNALGDCAGEDDSELKHSDATMNFTVPGSKSQSGTSAVDSSSQTNYHADTEMCTEGAKSGKKQLPTVCAEPAKRAPSRRYRSVPKRLLDMIENTTSHASNSARAKKSVKRLHGQASSYAESPGGEKTQKSQTMDKSSELVGEIKAIRAASTRNKAKGQPSFSEIIKAGLMSPGPQKFCVGQSEVTANIEEDGAIYFRGMRYRAVSKFALVVLRVRNPSRQSCDGWKEVSWNGEKLDSLRTRIHQQQSKTGP